MIGLSNAFAAARWSLTFVALASVTAPLRAQSAHGRIEGTVTDSAHARWPEGATLLAIRAEPPEHSGGATVDNRGRYRIDSLPAGRYMVELASPFLDSLEIARRKVHETSDLLTGIAGLMVVGHGPDAQATSTRGRRSGTGACVGMRIIRNGGLEGMQLNDIAPSEVAAIEVYPQGEFAPTQWAVRGACGVIVIWTKSARRGGRAPSDGKREAAPAQ